MVRSRSLVLLLPLVTLLAAAAAAQPIVLTGSISDRDGKPLPGARVQLFALESEYQTAWRWFAGEPEPKALAEAATDAEGRYRLEIAEPGFFTVRAAAAGHLARELPAVTPYVEDTELFAALLERAVEVVVRVEGPDGKARAGAWVAAAPPAREKRLGEDPWRDAPRRGRTGEDGSVALPRGAGEAPRWLTGAGVEVAAAPSRGPVTLRLTAASTRRLRVRDAANQPLAQALVTAGEGQWPLAAADAQGEVEIAVAIEIAKILRPQGAPNERRLPAAPVDKSPALVTLPATSALEGRVLDAATRLPIGGALVWDARRPETVARTRPDGTFLVSGLEPSGAPVRATARGYAAALAAGMAPKVGAIVRGPTISLSPARRLRGLVVDDGGRAVRGAEIVAQPDYPRAPRELTMLGTSAQPSRGRSDAQGRFTLGALVAGFPYSLKARAAGFAPAHLELQAEPAAAAEIQIVLSAGSSAAGTAVNRDRRPVRGAQAELRRTPGETDRFFSFNQADEPESAAADAAGRFEFPHLEAGRYTLKVSASGHAPVDVPGIEVGTAARAELGTVVLLPEAVIEGVVVDAVGNAVGGASIVVAEANPRRRMEALVKAYGSPAAESGADGWFRVGSLQPRAAVDVVVLAQGFAEQQVAGVVPLPAEEVGRAAAPLRVVLHPASRITGRVVDRRREPVAGANVFYGIERRTREMTLHAGGRPGPVSTDEDGRFELRDLAEGIVHVQVHAAGYQPGQLEVPVAPGRDALDLELVLLPGAVVSGHVLDASGAPVASAQVSVEGRGGGGPRALTDAEGVYRLDGVEQGKRILAAYDPRGQRVSKEVEVGSGETSADLVFAGGASVAGLVLDHDGLPIAEASVRLIGDARGFGDVRTASDGRFTIPDVADGAYTLSARKEGLAAAEVKVSVEGAPVSGLELRLERGATLVGELRGLKFSELPQARVVASRPGVWDSRQASADFAGRFRLRGLAPGEWQVVAMIESAGRQARAQVAVGPGDDEVPVVLEFGQGLALSGIVRRRGEPLGGAEVWLRGKDVADGGQASTTADGAFRIDGLEAGSYELSVQGAMRGAAHQQTLQLDADREIAIDLVAATVTGRVVDAATGESVVRAEVRLVEPDNDSPSPFGFRPSFTDSRGAFYFEDVAAGLWRLRAQASGYALAERDLTVGEDGASEAMDVALQPTEGLTLEVTVEGRATPGGSAIIVDDTGRVIWGGGFTAGEGGRARLESVPSGRYTAWVVAADSAPAAVAAAVPGPVVRVALQAGARLTVRVPDLASEARVAKVTLIDGAGQLLRVPSWQTLRSEFDLRYGRAQIRGVHAGPWTVTARAADGRVWQATVVISPGGGESEVELQKP